MKVSRTKRQPGPSRPRPAFTPHPYQHDMLRRLAVAAVNGEKLLALFARQCGRTSFYESFLPTLARTLTARLVRE